MHEVCSKERWGALETPAIATFRHEQTKAAQEAAAVSCILSCRQRQQESDAHTSEQKQMRTMSCC